MEPIPAADGASAPFELCESRLVDSRLGVDELGDGMDAWKPHGGLRVEALVEDRGEHGREGRAQAGGACCADCELETVGVEDERRCHAALEMVPWSGLAVGDVGLAEEVVQ